MSSRRTGGRIKPRGHSSTLLAGLAGGIAFIVFFVFLEAGIGISLAALAVGFLAGYLIGGDRDTPRVVDGVTEESLESALDEAEGKLKELKAVARRVENPEIRAKAEEIEKLVRAILDDIAADPRDLKPARQFLAYYFDATINILRQYADIMERGASAAEVRASVQRVEPVLETIRAAFEKQLARLLENDVLDLDTEIAVLEKTLKMEGLDAP